MAGCCWRSRAALAGLLVAAALAGGAPESPAKSARTDSGRVVQRVRISAGGIQVDSWDRDSARTGARVEISPGAISIDDDGSGWVRLFSDLHVPAGDRVEGDVVAVFGSVRVDGQVFGDVVAVFGTVRLGPQAVVDGDVVSVGGYVDRAPGAQIQGDTVGLSLIPMLSWGLPAASAMAFALLVGWALALFLGWLLTLLFPERFVAVAATASRRTGLSFLLGVVSGPLFLVAMCLLFITIVGIPLAFLLPVVYMVAIFVGQCAASYVLGCRLSLGRRRPEEGRGLVGGLALGSGFVVAILLVAIALFGLPGPGRVGSLFFASLGGLVALGLSAIGTGAVILSRGGSRPVAAASEAAPVGPLQPAPSNPVA